MRLPLFVISLFFCTIGCFADVTALAQDTAVAAAAEPSSGPSAMPLVLLVIGIVSVLGMIIGLKLNAFMALILSALIVSLGVGLVDGEDAGSRMQAVVNGFGGAAGSIGIVIAMAAIIGKCMLDSGAADRIVRSAVNVTGEKKASLGLMFSGFVLAIPVFFDTVFYLLVPLARQPVSKNRQTLSAIPDGDRDWGCDHPHIGASDARATLGVRDSGSRNRNDDVGRNDGRDPVSGRGADLQHHRGQEDAG